LRCSRGGNDGAVISDLWYRNAVFYSVSVESFMDGDGDGVGDFVGLSRRLDYLEALGVDVLWLAPSQPTPLKDDGYDTSDYYGIDRRLGTNGDFVEFVHAAAGRGIRVIIDLVVNHTSNRHRWFQEACSDARSPYRDWYVWARKRPPDWDTGMVFPGVQRETWSFERRARAWYFHRFYDFEPDLNMENPRVREEVRKIVGYWLQLGVAGFRVDAVPFVIEKPQPDGGKAPLRFEYLRELREFLQWRVSEAVLLGEANVLPKESSRYLQRDSGLHMMFNFWVNQWLFYALASGDARPLAQALRDTQRIPEGSQWVYFLRNHDELDLGHLSDRQRAEVFDAFAPEPSMQLYGRGIRRRLVPMLGDRARIELAYSVMFSLPGAPALRYGDEIGMGEDLRLKERNAIRTPMQWSAEANAGFSTGQTLVRPVIDRGAYGYREVNAEQQRRDPDSLLRWLTRMIRARKECHEIGSGTSRIVGTRNPHVLAVLHEWTGSRLLCVHNFDGEGHPVTLSLDACLTSVFDDEAVAARGGKVRLELEPSGYRWFRLDR
jgi:maltose alpha-D-glucosyltransferase/alpha-amylase